MAYLGTQPNNVKDNIGLYSPSEIYDLEIAGHWTGSLEHIETVTASSSSIVEFDNLGVGYEAHCVTVSGLDPLGDNKDLECRVKVGGSAQSGASDYKRILQLLESSGSYHQSKDNAIHQLKIVGEIGSATGEAASGHQYIWNALDSAKYTYFTSHFIALMHNGVLSQSLGGGMYVQTGTLSGMQYYLSGSQTFNGTFKLYGIKLKK